MAFLLALERYLELIYKKYKQIKYKFIEPRYSRGSFFYLNFLTISKVSTLNASTGLTFCKLS
jgi:hypothetical protein